mmetsp:Transcript_4849/g.12278  ORF Transcript_4849/g.12278 Transcript_4849/m.12278 type:complete len:337 (+) Transcript_4849:340-1350(+)
MAVVSSLSTRLMLKASPSGTVVARRKILRARRSRSASNPCSGGRSLAAGMNTATLMSTRTASMYTTILGTPSPSPPPPGPTAPYSVKPPAAISRALGRFLSSATRANASRNSMSCSPSAAQAFSPMLSMVSICANKNELRTPWMVHCASYRSICSLSCSNCSIIMAWLKRPPPLRRYTLNSSLTNSRYFFHTSSIPSVYSRALRQTLRSRFTNSGRLATMVSAHSISVASPRHAVRPSEQCLAAATRTSSSTNSLRVMLLLSLLASLGPLAPAASSMPLLLLLTTFSSSKLVVMKMVSRSARRHDAVSFSGMPHTVMSSLNSLSCMVIRLPDPVEE